MADVEWLTYTNSQFRFSIAYPNSYVILEETEEPHPSEPALAFRVSFQDRKLTTADTANLELPQTTIDVIRNEDHASLEQWLEAHASGDARSPVMAGSLRGYRVSRNLLLAPNEFNYFGSNTLIYKLTLLGQFSPQMLASFKIW